MSPDRPPSRAPPGLESPRAMASSSFSTPAPRQERDDAESVVEASSGSHEDGRAAPDAATSVDHSQWRLVWCSEKCHREDSKIREDIVELASRLGWRPVLLKRAKRFRSLSLRRDLRPYVLISDWREAKPCMQVALRAVSDRGLCSWAGRHRSGGCRRLALLSQAPCLVTRLVASGMARCRRSGGSDVGPKPPM